MDSIELRTWAVSYTMVKDAVKVHTNDNPKVKSRRGIGKKWN